MVRRLVHCDNPKTMQWKDAELKSEHLNFTGTKPAHGAVAPPQHRIYTPSPPKNDTGNTCSAYVQPVLQPAADKTACGAGGGRLKAGTYQPPCICGTTRLRKPNLLDWIGMV
jgi:hypothetical protein